MNLLEFIKDHEVVLLDGGMGRMGFVWCLMKSTEIKYYLLSWAQGHKHLGYKPFGHAFDFFGAGCLILK